MSLKAARQMAQCNLECAPALGLGRSGATVKTETIIGSNGRTVLVMLRAGDLQLPHTVAFDDPVSGDPCVQTLEEGPGSFPFEHDYNDDSVLWRKKCGTRAEHDRADDGTVYPKLGSMSAYDT